MEEDEENERQISVNQIFQRTNNNESVAKKILTTGLNDRYDCKRLIPFISNKIRNKINIFVNNNKKCTQETG